MKYSTLLGILLIGLQQMPAIAVAAPTSYVVPTCGGFHGQFMQFANCYSSLASKRCDTFATTFTDSLRNQFFCRGTYQPADGDKAGYCSLEVISINLPDEQVGTYTAKCVDAYKAWINGTKINPLF
jgi:hypothetical protein